MNREIYEQLENDIESDYRAKKEALSLLADVMKIDKKIPEAKPRRVSKPAVLSVPKAAYLRTPRPLSSTKCEQVGCEHRVQMGKSPCAVCSKKICALHKRGDVCSECKSVNAA